MIDSQGACVPVARGEDLVDSCGSAECGDKTIGAPVYQMVIVNPPDNVLRDALGDPILVDGLVVALTP